jgi:RNA polymerase sigma factor (sigma-70 family)
LFGSGGWRVAGENQPGGIGCRRRFRPGSAAWGGCDATGTKDQLEGVGQITSSSLNSPSSRLAPQGSGPPDDAVAEFEALYRANVAAVTAYFARRSADPQTVLDLTADTFVQAITSFATFDPRKGTPRGWVFGIARRIYAAHCQAYSRQRSSVARLAGRLELAPDEVGELIARIDAERAGRALVTGLTRLPAADRAVVELVDLAGLQPTEAARVLGVAPGTLRMRLMRARARLRKAASPDPASEQG